MPEAIYHDPDTNYVLVKPSLALEIPHFFFSAYEESFNSQITEFNGKPTHALFLNVETARDTSLWQGWIEVTEEYKSERQKLTEEKPEEKPEPVKVEAPKAAKAAPKKAAPKKKTKPRRKASKMVIK